jgi:outer membrane receptor protein involved in Fe transport
MRNIFLALLLIGHVATAQNKQADSLKTESLQEVIITANRSATLRKEVPVAISKITQRLINETKPTSVYEIVNKTPGVLMVNLGNEQHSMSIRQPMTTNSYYLYLEDGLPIRPMGVFNHNALLEINQFNLQNIEVVKGPVSSLYGPEAVGGAVNFISIRPPLDSEVKIGVQADQWGFKKIQAAGGATIGKFGFHIAGLYSDQKNGWMTYSDYDKKNINARFDYKFNSNTRLISNTMFGKYYSDMSGSVDENAFYQRTYESKTDFTYRKSEALRTRLTLEHDWNDFSNTTLTVFHRDNKMGQNPSYSIRWSPTPSATNDPTKARGEINSNDFKSYGATAQHVQKFTFLEAKLIGGLLYDYSPVDYWSHQIDLEANLNPDGQSVDYYEIIAYRPDIKIANYNAGIYNTAEYIQLSFKPINNVIITAGSRYDNMKIEYTNNLDTTSGSKVYDQFTFKAGINYNPIQQIGFYGNYSQGFAPPGVTAIFRKKPGTGTATVPAEFYYNLKPANFENYEIGGWLNLIKNKLCLEYSFYYMEGKNELLSIRQPDNSTDYQSAGKTRHKGIEFGLNYKPSDQFTVRMGGTTAQHTFIDFKVSDKPTDVIQRLDGYEMPSAPKWSGNSEISYYPKWLPDFRTSLEWQFVSSWYQNQINTVKYDGYNVFNGRIAYQWKGMEIYANIMNITDKLYAYNVSRGNNATDRSSYTAAAPRTFMVGLQYQFSFKKN